MNLNNLKNYFVFRVKYFFRLLNYDLDKVIAYIIFWVFIFFYDFKNEWFYLIYYLLPPLYFHTKREDITFLKKVFNNDSYFFIVIDYLLINALTFSLIINKVDQKTIHIIGFAICFVLPILKYKNVEWTKRLNLNFIPIDAYEWKSYIRQKPISFILTYLLLILSSYHPFSLGIMSFLFCGTINSIYSISEPKDIYCLYYRNKNVNDKLLSSLKFSIKITLPIYILCCLINTTLIPIVFVVYCVLLMFHIDIILRKYANYKLDYKKNRPINSMKIIEIFFSIILVIPWVFNYHQLKKKSTLKISKNVRG